METVVPKSLGPETVSGAFGQSENRSRNVGYCLVGGTVNSLRILRPYGRQEFGVGSDSHCGVHAFVTPRAATRSCYPGLVV